VHELWVLVVAGSNPASPTISEFKIGIVAGSVEAGCHREIADFLGSSTGLPEKWPDSQDLELER
jgi:hypothetical protein